MTRSTVRSATTFHSDTVATPTRPTTEVTIGAGTYTARAPKYQVWWDVVSMMEGNELATAAAERLTADGAKLTVAEQRELLEQVSVVPSFAHMQAAVIYGSEDPATGRVRGGFLRQCLAAQDWEAVRAEVDDNESDLDLPDLYQAAMALQGQFTPWFIARSNTMGLPAPQPSGPARKAPAKRKA